jgi:uncharacterized cupredoxin-like copper-binding protein
MIWKSTLAAAAVAGLALLLSACGGSMSSPHAASTGAVAGASSQTLVVRESEYKLALSTQTVAPGRTTIVARNVGKIAHSLEIDGPGVSDKRIAGTIEPGQQKTLRVTLKPGSYELYCPVDGHKGLGMRTQIHVGTAKATTPAAGGTTTGGTATTNGSSGGSWG